MAAISPLRSTHVELDPFHEADLSGNTELHTFMYLIDRGFGDPDYKRLDFLLKNTKDINAQNKSGWTALHLAVAHFHNFNTHWKVVEMLLEHGASHYVTTKDGDLVLDVLRRYAANFPFHVSARWIKTFEERVAKYSTLKAPILSAEERQKQMNALKERIVSLVTDLSLPLYLPQMSEASSKEEHSFMHSLGISVLDTEKSVKQEELSAKLTRLHELWKSSELKSFSLCFEEHEFDSIKEYFGSSKKALEILQDKKVEKEASEFEIPDTARNFKFDTTFIQCQLKFDF